MNLPAIKYYSDKKDQVSLVPYVTYRLENMRQSVFFSFLQLVYFSCSFDGLWEKGHYFSVAHIEKRMWRSAFLFQSQMLLVRSVILRMRLMKLL